MSQAVAASPTRLKIQIELISWLITAIVTYLVVSPILSTFAQFQFLYSNVLFVVAFLTAARLIFLLPYSLIAYSQPIKIVLIFACLPLVFYLIQDVQAFEEFSNDEGLAKFEEFMNPNLPYEAQQNSLNYMRREMIFFGTASVITSILLPFRLLISVWRVYNQTGKV